MATVSVSEGEHGQEQVTAAAEALSSPERQEELRRAIRRCKKLLTRFVSLTQQPQCVYTEK